MPTKEYVKTARKARQFLLDADAAFADGDDCRPASEKLWQAAAHAITAAAQQRGWPCGSPQARQSAVNRLAEELDDEMLILQFDVADTFRVNAEYGFMEDFQIPGNRREVHLFVEQVLLLPGMSDDGDAGN